MNGDHAGKAKPSGSSVYVARVGWIVVLKLPVTFLNAITFFTRYTRTRYCSDSAGQFGKCTDR